MPDIFIIMSMFLVLKSVRILLPCVDNYALNNSFISVKLFVMCVKERADNHLKPLPSNGKTHKHSDISYICI